MGSKVMIQHSSKFCGLMGVPAGHPILKVPKQVCLIHSLLEEFKKLEGKDGRRK